MKTLTLVRHAKSSWDKTELPDQERPLNSRGKHDAPVMGRRLAEAGISPSLIVASPAVRALTTAAIIAEHLGMNGDLLHSDNNLYMASLEDLLGVVIAQDEAIESLMLVAHNPGLTDFANYLIPGLTDNLPTTGVVAITINQTSWDLYDRPSTDLILYDFPKNYA